MERDLRTRELREERMRVLAGDVGGTNARLALVEVSEGRAEIEVRRDFETESYPGLAAVVREFLSALGERPARATIGVACPLQDGRCRFLDLDWVVEIDALREEIGMDRTFLVNDSDAVAHALRGVDRSSGGLDSPRMGRE